MNNDKYKSGMLVIPMNRDTEDETLEARETMNRLTQVIMGLVNGENEDGSDSILAVVTPQEVGVALTAIAVSIIQNLCRIRTETGLEKVATEDIKECLINAIDANLAIDQDKVEAFKAFLEESGCLNEETGEVDIRSIAMDKNKLKEVMTALDESGLMNNMDKKPTSPFSEMSDDELMEKSPEELLSMLKDWNPDEESNA